MKTWWKKLSAGLALAALVCALVPMVSPRDVAAEGEDKPVYHAAMGIQTATQIWIQRWGYYDASYNEYYDTENYSKLYDSNKTFYDGTFEDVEIKGNGTYTVALKDADFAGETTVSQLHIATDIPVAESEKLQFTDVTLEINDKEVVKFDQAVMEDEENYMQGGAVILLYNHWRDGLKKTLSDMGAGEDSDNGWEVLQGSGDNVAVTFTVSGLPYDNEEQAAEEDTGNGTKETLDAAENTSSDVIKADTSHVEDGSMGTAQIVGIVAIAIVALVLVIILNIKKKGSY